MLTFTYIGAFFFYKGRPNGLEKKKTGKNLIRDSNKSKECDPNIIINLNDLQFIC